MSTSKLEPAIEGIKLIHMTGVTTQADDPSYPYKLYVNLCPPELMRLGFITLHGGSDEIVLRARTRESIDEFMRRNDIRTHQRLRRGVISGPDNLREEFGHDH